MVKISAYVVESGLALIGLDIAQAFGEYIKRLVGLSEPEIDH